MISAGIDLSVATTATAAAYVMSERSSQGDLQAVVVGLALGLAVGLVNGIGVGIFRVNPLIMTLGMSGVTFGGLAVYAQSNQASRPCPAPSRRSGPRRFRPLRPGDLFLWLPLAVILILGLRNSGFGRMLYAVGDNPVACRLAGVRVWQVQVAVYALCGLLSALAGILLVGFNNAADLVAGADLLPVVAAVVIGGTSIFGGIGGYLGTPRRADPHGARHAAHDPQRQPGGAADPLRLSSCWRSPRSTRA